MDHVRTNSYKQGKLNHVLQQTKKENNNNNLKTRTTQQTYKATSTFSTILHVT